MTACQRSLPRSPRSNKYSQEYAGRVVSRQSGTRRRSVIRLFHGVARYNQVFHAIDSLTSLSLSRPILVANLSYPSSLSLFLLDSFRSKRFSTKSKQSQFSARNCADRISTLVLGNFMDHPAEIRCRTRAFKFSGAGGIQCKVLARATRPHQ